MKSPGLPDTFLFGSATSAHQVEGGTTNDWTRWERGRAKEVAKSIRSTTGYGQGPSPIWPLIKDQATSPANYISGTAADHYNRYPEDLTLAGSLGLTAYRFSVEWARIEPTKGTYDNSAIEHYVNVAQAARAAGQEPFVTLWHFTLPQWAADEGGWASADVVEHFTRYAATMASALSPVVNRIATLNEPEVYAPLAHLIGLWPPNHRSLPEFLRVRQSLVRAHKQAYAAIKTAHPHMQVGFCTSQAAFQARLLVFGPLMALVEAVANDYFVNRLKTHTDWLGAQYYVTRSLPKSDHARRSDLGWRLHPEGHATVLRKLGRHHKPIYVTESGLADATDKYRAKYIEDSLKSIAEAIADGVDCRGYFHWSLLDNFEWHEGFWPKFGLIEVDRTTMKRTIRPSAQHYAKLITQYQEAARHANQL